MASSSAQAAPRTWPVRARALLQRWRKGLARFLRVFKKLRVLKRKGTAVVVLALGAMLLIYRELAKEVIIVEPFNVPKKVEEYGYTPQTVANLVADSIADVRWQASQSAKYLPGVAISSEADMPDVEVPELKVSLKAVIEYLRRLLGMERASVEGDITFPAKGEKSAEDWEGPVSQILITIRVHKGEKERHVATIAVPSSEILSGIAQASYEVLRSEDPFVLGVYLLRNRRDFDVASALAEQCSHSRKRRYAAQCYSLWGSILSSQNRLDEAILKFKAAHESDPKLVLATLNWGVALARQGKLDQAVSMFRTAELDAKSQADLLASIYLNWGFALSEQNKLDDAVAMYAKATQQDPDYALAYNNWCDVLLRQNKLEEAIANCKTAVQKDPGFAMAYATWGQVLEKQHKLDEAIGMFKKATGDDPESAIAWDLLGDALDRAGRSEEAAAARQQAAALRSSDVAPGPRRWSVHRE